MLNRTQYPSDVIALVVLWRLRYRLTLRDLAEMFLIRGIVFSYEAVREWEAKLTPILADELRHRRRRHRLAPIDLPTDSVIGTPSTGSPPGNRIAILFTDAGGAEMGADRLLSLSRVDGGES